MRQVVVLGGYGHIGRLCVRELVERTDAHVVVAGRSVQRADALALSYGERVRGAYCNALDPRTVERALAGSEAVVACCGGDLLPLIDVALNVRVPFIGLTPVALDKRVRDLLGERSWQAGLPLVLQAGAVPGLLGIACELLVRSLPEIQELRVASTGPWLETEAALRDHRQYRARSPEPQGRAGRWLPVRWTFAEVGARALRASSSADLEGFAEAHCVERLSYLEPARGPLARGLDRLRGDDAELSFALAAQATLLGAEGGPTASVEFYARSPLLPAAAIAGALVAGALEGALSAGLQTPRDALNPALALRELEKRGVRVSTQGID